VLIEGGHKNASQAIETLRSQIGDDKAFLRIKSCGIGGKVDNPILQAADMLAYSEWKGLTKSGREIFDALHNGGGPYRAYFFDIAGTIDPIKDGVSQFEAARKRYGLRKPKQV
jgi:hypothetical protein